MWEKDKKLTKYKLILLHFLTYVNSETQRRAGLIEGWLCVAGVNQQVSAVIRPRFWEH